MAPQSTPQPRSQPYTSPDTQDHRIHRRALDASPHLPRAREQKDPTMPLIEHTAPETGHLIEDAVVLYLIRDQEQWVIDPTTIDGEPLESALIDTAKITADCTCTRTEEHNLIEQRRHQPEMHLPTSEQLLHALAVALGYTLRKDN